MADVATMAAGPEMDRLVAEVVMGFEPDPTSDGAAYRSPWSEWVSVSGGVQRVCELVWLDKWKPSTDIGCAWEVVEGVRWRGWSPSLCEHTVDGDVSRVDGWQCLLEDGDGPAVIAHGETAPLAICRAALIALGVKEV